MQWITRASQNVNVDEAPGDRGARTSGHTKALLVNEHGRTMGSPRCSSGIGIHNAECRARIEVVLLQQSRMKPAEEVEPRCGHNDEISATGFGEADRTCASRRQQRVWYSETRHPELGRREMLTRDCWKRPMSR